jgi:hypothetical protein
MAQHVANEGRSVMAQHVTNNEVVTKRMEQQAESCSSTQHIPSLSCDTKGNSF